MDVLTICANVRMSGLLPSTPIQLPTDLVYPPYGGKLRLIGYWAAGAIAA